MFESQLRGRLLAGLVLAAVAVLSSGCLGDDDDATAVPTQPPTATATGTVAPTPTTTGEPTATSTPGMPDRNTGIAEVDAVIEAVAARDPAALMALVALQSAECISPDTDGLGGPPRCQDGEAPGTAVQAFPLAYCEGTFSRNPAPELENFVSGVKSLHSVVQAPNEPRSEAYWPVGDYWINFVADFADWEIGVRLVVEDGALVLAFFGCGHTPESLMEHRGEPLPVLLAPLETATLEDGEYFAFIRGATGDQLLVDPAEFLTGDAATAAAREDGAIAPDETPPNDYYIRNSSFGILSAGLTPETTVQLIGFDSGGALDERSVPVEELTALLAGELEADRYYGYVPGYLPVHLTVDAGRALTVEQQYLP